MKKILLFLLLFCGLAKAQPVPNLYTVYSLIYPPIYFIDSTHIVNPASGDTIALGGAAATLSPGRNINGVLFDGSANITVTAAANTLTGSNLASGVTGSSLTSFGASIALGTPASGALTNCTSIPVVQATGVLPIANGGELRSSAATSATSGTMTVTMNTRYVTNTPISGETFNASGGVQGQTTTFVILTSGTSSFNIIFGTNFKAQSALSTGTVSGKIFTITFTCFDGTNWYETGRTTAM